MASLHQSEGGLLPWPMKSSVLTYLPYSADSAHLVMLCILQRCAVHLQDGDMQPQTAARRQNHSAVF